MGRKREREKGIKKCKEAIKGVREKRQILWFGLIAYEPLWVI